jgi:hypothetical protein
MRRLDASPRQGDARGPLAGHVGASAGGTRGLRGRRLVRPAPLNSPRVGGLNGMLPGWANSSATPGATPSCRTSPPSAWPWPRSASRTTGSTSTQGLTGTSRARPGLDQALAAVRTGDTLVVPKLDQLARSVPDARHIGDSLVARGIKLSLGGTLYDPADPLARCSSSLPSPNSKSTYLPSRRITIAGHPQRLGELTCRALQAWLSHRRATWPHTPNRQVLVPGKAALGAGPVSKSYLTWNLQRHRVSIERIRRDGVPHARKWRLGYGAVTARERTAPGRPGTAPPGPR